jgi:RNA polymerase sigma factor (sigma-70 family)
MAANAGNKAIRQLRRVLLLQDGADPTDGQLLGWFVEQHDEVALEALVRRHGPMVMGVCRRVLHNEHDAEDAFQATFLVLVRKAASIVPREKIANWLYGVAYQTAFRARVSNAKRRERQKQLMRVAQTSSVSPNPWDDLRIFLDREVSRLPEKYRAPLVLCDLEGKTRTEAAQHLGWPEGSVSSRLARARALLARRLSRRGLVLSAGTLAGQISVHGAMAGVPASLVASTVKAASPVATGLAGASALISANVAALAEGVLRSMFRAKLKGVIGVLLVLGMAAGVPCFGVVVLNNRLAVGQPLPEDRPAAAPPRSARQPRLRATFDGEKDGTAVAISGDGRVLTSQSEDEIVKLWDVGTGKEKTTLETMHKPPVAAVALNEDGKLLATAGGEGAVKLWDVARGTAKATLEGHTDKVTSVAVSADGKLVASGSEDNTVRLWDAVTGKEKAALKGHTGKVTSVALRRDGGLVVSGSGDNTVRLWDAATGREIVALPGHTAGVTSVAISRDGTVVASGSEDDTVRVWDVAAAKEKATFKSHRAEVLCVAISGDGKLLASGSGDKTIKLWDAIAAKEKATLEGHTDKVTSLAFDREGKLLVSGSKDKTARLWDIPVGSPKSQ